MSIYDSGSDPRSFMYYRGTFYINGTKFTLKEDYIKSHRFNGQPLWKYAKFSRQTRYNGQIGYIFSRDNDDWVTVLNMGLRSGEIHEYAAYFVIPALELENAIEEITKSIKLSEESQQAIFKALENMEPKPDWEYPELIGLWIAYIASLIGSLIFNQYYLLWIVITAIFLKLRKTIKQQ